MRLRAGEGRGAGPMGREREAGRGEEAGEGSRLAGPRRWKGDGAGWAGSRAEWDGE